MISCKLAKRLLYISLSSYTVIQPVTKDADPLCSSAHPHAFVWTALSWYISISFYTYIYLWLEQTSCIKTPQPVLTKQAKRRQCQGIRFFLVLSVNIAVKYRSIHWLEKAPVKHTFKFENQLAKLLTNCQNG